MRSGFLILICLALAGCASAPDFCAGTVTVRTKPATAAYVVKNDRDHGEDVAVNNRYRAKHCR